MARTLTPERQQKRAHAITLRKQGWTEQAIADELGIPRATLAHWLIKEIVQNHAIRNMNKPQTFVQNHAIRNMNNHVQFRSFLGRLESFHTDITFPLIIADPPWNISVENSMQFTFKDRKCRWSIPGTSL